MWITIDCETFHNLKRCLVFCFFVDLIVRFLLKRTLTDYLHWFYLNKLMLTICGLVTKQKNLLL